MAPTLYDAIVIGAGPAGLSAGIYLGRAKFKVLILDAGTVGGQLVLTHEIANYPGVEPISGYQLGMAMRKQAAGFGCKIQANVAIQSMDLAADTKKIVLDDGQELEAKTLIIASGGRPRTLGVEGESRFKGQGISYCATCDGDFFTGKEIAVVGGGNSALEEAVSLTKYASKVTLIHQFDHFQAFPHAIAQASAHPKINIIKPAVIEGFFGDSQLRGIRIKNLNTSETTQLPVDGVFIFIGYVPGTEFIEGIIEMNQRNEILVDANMATSISGVYAAGDCVQKKYRQVTTSVADGTIAALSAAEFLSSQTQS